MAQNEGLTERERQVLALRATGKKVPEVAAALCVTERTANFHLSNIYAKLGLEQLTPGERQLRLAAHAQRIDPHTPQRAERNDTSGTDVVHRRDSGDPTQKGRLSEMTAPLPLPPDVKLKHPVVTFRVTRLPDGRICAQNRVWHSYKDELSGCIVEGTYSGKLIGDDKDMAPGPMLDQRLRRRVAGDFDLLPRPLTVRVVYDGEGLRPAGTAETSFTVSDYGPEK